MRTSLTLRRSLDPESTVKRQLEVLVQTMITNSSHETYFQLLGQGLKKSKADGIEARDERIKTVSLNENRGSVQFNQEQA